MFTGPHEWNLDRSEDGGWRRREDNTRNVTEELVLQTIHWFHNWFLILQSRRRPLLTMHGVNPRLAKCQSVLNVKAVVATFKQEKAFSKIVETDCETDRIQHYS